MVVFFFQWKYWCVDSLSCFSLEGTLNVLVGRLKVFICLEKDSMFPCEDECRGVLSRRSSFMDVHWHLEDSS